MTKEALRDSALSRVNRGVAMHEQSLVAELLDLIAQQTASISPAVVLRVEVEAGRLAGVEPELLRSAFEMQAPAQLGPQCQLTIDEPAVRAICDDCRQEFVPRAWDFFCPSCQSGATRVLSGDRLILKRLVVRGDDTEPSPCNSS